MGCAVQAGYTLGFDVTPIKGSRKDQITTVTLGNETGALTAAIWCKEHQIKTFVHPISEDAGHDEKTALQVFVENYKQADRTLTGTARKANLLSQSIKLSTQSAAAPLAANRRVSMASNATRGHRHSSAGLPRVEDMDGASPQIDSQSEAAERRCVTCGIDVSPKWWPVDKAEEQGQATDSNHDVEMTGVLSSTPQANGISVKEETSNGTWSSVEAPAQVTDVEAQQHCCHKCRWKKIHDPEPEVNQKIPSPSPPKPLPAQPAYGDGVTSVGSQFPHPPTVINHPSDGPSDGRAVTHAPAAQGLNAGYPQINGFAPPSQPPHSNGVAGYSQPPHMPGSHFSMVREQAPPHIAAAQYGQGNGQIPPAHHHQHAIPPMKSGPSGLQSLPNGVPHSSPTYLGAGMAPLPQQYPPARTSESPFGVPTQGQVINGQHGSPPNSFVRPATPRDSSVDARANTNAGASASPNLRNLLH